MDVKPPAGSLITIATDGSDPIIVIPNPTRPMVRIAGLFMTFWLFGAAGVSLSAASKLLSGNGNMFLVFWMGLWTLGVVSAAHVVYRALRRPKP